MAAPNYTQQITTIKIIHLAMTMMLVAFGGVVLFLNLTDPIAELNDGNRILLYIPALMLIAAFPIASFLFKKQTQSPAIAEKTLSQKITIFQSSHLVRMAVFEAAGFCAIVMSLVTGNNYNLGVLGFVLILFFMQMPSASKIAMSMQLSGEERDQLTGGK